MKNIFCKIKQNAYLSYFIILIATILVCIPLFKSNLNIIKDDGIQHILRIVGTERSIKENALFPLIMSNFCNGFGYSWNIFYSPFTAYVPVILKLITSSYIMALKTFMFGIMLFSAIFMYKLVLKISKSKKAALLSSIIYLVEPYHLTDMYARIAVAELASFMFLPIVFIGMYDIFEEEKKQSYYLSIGAIGLILTHNVLTVYTAIFCLIYCIIYIKKLKNKEILEKLLINLSIILLVTSFYWVPLLEHYFATQYEVFVPNRMYNDKIIVPAKLTLEQLIYEKKHHMLITIGLPCIIGILLFIVSLIKNKMKSSKNMLIFLCFGIISTIMASRIFPFEYLPNMFKMIQFPWRMIEFSNFFFAIVSGITIVELFKNKVYKFIAIIMIGIIIIWNTIHCLTIIVDYTELGIEEELLEPKQVTENTKRVHAGCASFEYLPTKAFQNYSYIVTRDEEIIVTKGNANVSKFEKKNGIGKATIIKSRR